jgi:hypothetical protein
LDKSPDKAHQLRHAGAREFSEVLDMSDMIIEIANTSHGFSGE